MTPSDLKHLRAAGWADEAIARNLAAETVRMKGGKSWWQDKPDVVALIREVARAPD